MARKKVDNVIIKNANFEAVKFCFKKGFKIYPVVISRDVFKVKYEAFGKVGYYKKGQLYSKKEIDQAIWDLHNEMYNYFKDK